MEDFILKIEFFAKHISKFTKQSEKNHFLKEILQKPEFMFLLEGKYKELVDNRVLFYKNKLLDKNKFHPENLSPGGLSDVIKQQREKVS